MLAALVVAPSLATLATTTGAEAATTMACPTTQYASVLADSATGVSPAFAASVRVYDENGSLVATPADGLSTANTVPIASPDRSAIAWSGVESATGIREIFAADADGSHVRRVSTNASTNNAEPSWDRFSTKLVWSGIDTGGTGQSEIFVGGAGGAGAVTRVSTAGSTANNDPSFSFDATRVAWVGTQTGLKVFTAKTDGSATASMGASARKPAWSPIDLRIAWTEFGSGYALRIGPADASTAPITLAAADWTPYYMAAERPQWAPDGHAIAADFLHVSPGGGTMGSSADTLYMVVTAPDGSWSTGLGWPGVVIGGEPRWSPDSTRLAYRSYTEESMFLASAGGVTYGVSGELFVADAYGANAARPPGTRPAVTGHYVDMHPTWSTDSRMLAWESEIWTSGYPWTSDNKFGDVSFASHLSTSTISLLGSAGSPSWAPDTTRVAIGPSATREVRLGPYAFIRPPTVAPVVPAITHLDGSSTTLTGIKALAPAAWTVAACPSMTGTVRNGSGDPLPGIAVSAVTAGFALVQTTTTDVFGRYRFEGLAAGPYRLKFFDGAGVYQRTWSGGAPTFKVAEQLAVVSGSTVVSDIVLAAQVPGMIAGLVTDEVTGLPIAGIVASVYSSDGLVATARTGPAGAFVVRGILPGTYHVHLADSNHIYQSEWWKDAPRAADSRPLVITTSPILIGDAMGV